MEGQESNVGSVQLAPGVVKIAELVNAVKATHTTLKHGIVKVVDTTSQQSMSNSVDKRHLT